MAQGTWSTVRKRSAWLLLQGLVGVGLVILVVGLAQFRDYVETSPRFCQGCHAVEREIAIWTESEHQQIRCQQCHHQTLSDGVRILTAFVSGQSPDGNHAPVDVQSCADCHASHDTKWPQIANSIGHRVHAESANIACTKCHGRQMHFYRPPRSTCVECHPDNAKTGASHEQNHCLACHNFLSTGEVILPSRRDCLSCHTSRERPVVVSDSSPMQFACFACHKPHRGREVVACDECHAPRDLAGLHLNRGHTSCASCHKQHTWQATRQYCYACHTKTYSHHPEQKCTSCHSFQRGLNSGP